MFLFFNILELANCGELQEAIVSGKAKEKINS